MEGAAGQRRLPPLFGDRPPLNNPVDSDAFHRCSEIGHL